MRLYHHYLMKNDCFRRAELMRPKGVMVHSTGANNPWVSRYVPGNAEIGRNLAGNHWDQSNAEWERKFGVPLNKCVHAFVGKLADGGVGVVQTLPWSFGGWHAGGTANEDYIGFEICEDGLNDRAYFCEVYQAAVELTAHLCRQFALDPLADGTVICHAEGYDRGIASNHADVFHWFPKHGKTMNMFRKDVKTCMDGGDFKQQFDQMRQELRTNDHADWSAQALDWAVERGLFAGAPGTDGHPNYMWQDLVTREQLAVVLYQFAKQLGM